MAGVEIERNFFLKSASGSRASSNRASERAIMRALGLTLVVLGLCGYGGTTLGFHVGSSSVSVSLSASRRAQGAKRGGSGGCLGGGLPGRSSDCSRSRDSSFRPARQQSPFSSSPSHLLSSLPPHLITSSPPRGSPHLFSCSASLIPISYMEQLGPHRTRTGAELKPPTLKPQP